jgi:hypothetical protein
MIWVLAKSRVKNIRGKIKNENLDTWNLHNFLQILNSEFKIRSCFTQNWHYYIYNFELRTCGVMAILRHKNNKIKIKRNCVFTQNQHYFFLNFELKYCRFWLFCVAHILGKNKYIAYIIRIVSIFPTILS